MVLSNMIHRSRIDQVGEGEGVIGAGACISLWIPQSASCQFSLVGMSYRASKAFTWWYYRGGVSVVQESKTFQTPRDFMLAWDKPVTSLLRVRFWHDRGSQFRSFFFRSFLDVADIQVFPNESLCRYSSKERTHDSVVQGPPSEISTRRREKE